MYGTHNTKGASIYCEAVTSNVEGWVDIIPGVVLYNTTKSYKDAASNCSVVGKILDGISVSKIPPLKVICCIVCRTFSSFVLYLWYVDF